MSKSRRLYTKFQQISAMLMILALFWLTVSAPIVYASQQELAKMGKASGIENSFPCNEEEAPNPMGNSTEEKAPNSSTVSEEYLHNNHHPDYFSLIASNFHQCENAGTYIAFHGELLVPPPNQA